jgi:hypothetical protein
VPFGIDVNMAISVLNFLIPATNRGVSQFLTSIRDLLLLVSGGGGTLPF